MTLKSPMRYAQTSNEDSPNNFKYSFPPLAFARYNVGYNIGEMPNRTYQSYCEIDHIGLKFPGLTRLNHDGEMGCFEYLLSNGIGSKLTNHFIDCERKKRNYTLPSNNKTVIIQTLIQEKGKKKNKKGVKKSTYPSLRICGFENIKEIGLQDPLFYIKLFWAADQGLCEISGIDLCVDFGHNLMKYLGVPVLDGKLQSFGDGQVKIYGKVGSKTYQGDSIGPQSKTYKSISKLDNVTKNFSQIGTVYVGAKKYTPHNLVIYDKESQQANKNQQQTSVASRIEIRLSTTPGTFYKEVLPWLILSLSTLTGVIYRQIVFYVVLFTFYRVTTVQQLRNINSNFLDLKYSSFSLMILLNSFKNS